MTVYLMSADKLSLVKFHDGSSTQTPCSAPTYSIARPYSCWFTPTWKIYTDKICVNSAL